MTDASNCNDRIYLLGLEQWRRHVHQRVGAGCLSQCIVKQITHFSNVYLKAFRLRLFLQKVLDGSNKLRLSHKQEMMTTVEYEDF